MPTLAMKIHLETKLKLVSFPLPPLLFLVLLTPRFLSLLTFPFPPPLKYPLYISSSYLYARIIFGLTIDGIPGSRLAGMVVLMTLDSWHSLAHCDAATE